MSLQISLTYFLVAFAVCAVIVPLIGGGILLLMFRLMKVANVTYKRCWLAYLAAWLAASVLCSGLFILLFKVADPKSLHLNLVGTVGIACHLIIVPLAMRVGWGKAAAAQVLTILVYSLLLLPGAIVLASHLRGKAERILAQNNLREITQAMRDHADSTKSLPADAIYSKDGKPLLSWRVALLPYLEQQALYDRFKLDEPWDSEHNLALVSQMPAVYRMPGVEQKEAGMTHFQVFVQTWPKGRPESPGGFEGTAPFGPLRPGYPPRGTRPEQLQNDGEANTLLVVEAAQAVAWTKPADLPFGPGLPLPALGAAGDGFFAAVFADMHTRLLSTALDEKTLRAMITYNGSDLFQMP